MVQQLNEFEVCTSIYFVLQYVGVASYTILIYDHLLTFGEEVEYIWKGHKGPSTVSDWIS